MYSQVYTNIFFYTPVLEYVGPQHRTWAGNLAVSIFFGGGCMLLPWLAIWIANWRTLLWLTTMPISLVLVSPWVLPESVR